MASFSLFSAPELSRSDTARGTRPRGVDRKGGDNSMGLIQGLSMIVRGDALGHGMFIDKQMLASVAEQVNTAGDLGIKARFAHPSMSGDGIGTSLGRLKNASIGASGNSVEADLHFSVASTKTPDGNLADYVMALAEGEDDHFGFSISFERDPEAEDQFVADNSKESKFTSPDEKNTENLRHVRLKKLRAADAVDTPAANPNGLFYSAKNPVLESATEALNYLFGLSEAHPDATVFGVHTERAKGFLTRFLESNNLEVVDANTHVEYSNIEKPNPKNYTIVTETAFAALEERVKSLSSALAGISAAPAVPETPIEAPAVEFSRADALIALGMTEEQFTALETAQVKKASDDADAALAAAVQKQMDLMGLTATPATPANESAAEGNDPKPEAAPMTWSQTIEADATLAEGLDFADEWARGDVNLSNLPNTQDAFLLMARADIKHGLEEAWGE